MSFRMRIVQIDKPKVKEPVYIIIIYNFVENFIAAPFVINNV